MKIAWFTPFDVHSAIGQVSKLVCEELQKTCEVDIFAIEHDQMISSTVSVVNYNPLNFDIRCLDGYDHVVHNMGNYARNHREVWEVMQQYPGILLLHDQIMQNFFHQITMVPEFGGNPATGELAYLELMRKCYGRQGEAVGKALYSSYVGENMERIWFSDAAMAYPLFEPLLEKATAVFTHAAFFVKKIKEHFYGPTGFAYLPYSPEPLHADLTVLNEFRDKSKALVVSNGIVHPVKRIERVAEMLLANPDIARRVQYAVVGGYGGSYGKYLSSLAQGPLKGCLHLLDYQPYEVMEAFLQKADFCVNLRYPNSEVCSKSLIEQMAFANPVIVLDKGIFGEIPDDCVVRIKMEDEMSELANAFRLLLDDKERRHEIGNHAADFVRAHCSAEVYASRFKLFLEGIQQTAAVNKVVNETVRLNRTVLRALSFNQESVPWVIDTVGRELSRVCCAVPSKQSGEQVIGIWFGFPYAVGLRREGITRFMLYMLLALLERYPLDCELWTYSFNEQEIQAGFELLLKDERFKNRIHIITEKNYQEVLNISSYRREIPFIVNETLDNLAYLAREYSKADCFVTAIVYLDNVIGTGRPLFVPVHDLGIHVHYDDFISIDPFYKARHVDIRSRAENLARSGAIMFSESEHVCREQILNYVSGVDAEHVDVVYFPVFLPNNIGDCIIQEEDIRKKFGLKKPYIFYPTQVRPYKNVGLLIEALALLKERNINVTLVLTGKPSDMPDVDAKIGAHKLDNEVICLSSVTEHELFSLYRYAAVTAVPTLFEGGFPLQASEALFMDCPLVLSDIAVVQERIEICGLTPDNCGLKLFDPYDPAACADAIEKVMQNREETLNSQRIFRDIFLSYTWDDAAAKYYKLFFEGKVNRGYELK